MGPDTTLLGVYHVLVLIEGPAGAGKSQIAAELLAAGAVSVLSDVTILWAALSGAVRGDDGRYPERDDDDEALSVARYVQAVAVRVALEAGASVAVTTSRRNQEQRWRQLADDVRTGFEVRTVDPGRAVVESRLSGDDGKLSKACEEAINRWYG